MPFQKLRTSPGSRSVCSRQPSPSMGSSSTPRSSRPRPQDNPTSRCRSSAVRGDRADGPVRAIPLPRHACRGGPEETGSGQHLPGAPDQKGHGLDGCRPHGRRGG
eukprot:5329964-Alexandrium_andersonii.AAC.1